MQGVLLDFLKEGVPLFEKFFELKMWLPLIRRRSATPSPQGEGAKRKRSG